jgi:hypothetical protein
MPTILPLQAHETVPLQAAMRNLWLGQTIKEAIDGRRIHHQLAPMHVSYEPDFSQVNKELKNKSNEANVVIINRFDKADIYQCLLCAPILYLSEVKKR